MREINSMASPLYSILDFSELLKEKQYKIAENKMNVREHYFVKNFSSDKRYNQKFSIVLT